MVLVDESYSLTRAPLDRFRDRPFPRFNVRLDDPDLVVVIVEAEHLRFGFAAQCVVFARFEVRSDSHNPYLRFAAIQKFCSARAGSWLAR
jgi:hypothetical protein